MPVFRFAPSPNGLLHLGHAYCALLNAQMAAAAGGVCLLRIEDIDKSRCREEFYQAIHRDLAWLGLHYPRPVRHQSRHFADYAQKLQQLIEVKLIYPAFLTRGEVRRYITMQPNAATWPHDPDGVPLYPTFERDMPAFEAKRRMESGTAFAWRLNMEAALERVAGNLSFTETGSFAANHFSLKMVSSPIGRRVAPPRRPVAVSAKNGLLRNGGKSGCMSA